MLVAFLTLQEHRQAGITAWDQAWEVLQRSEDNERCTDHKSTTTTDQQASKRIAYLPFDKS